MRKILLILAVLTAPFFAAYSQNTDGSDDVYYNGDNDQYQTDQNNANYQDNSGDPNAPTYQTFYDQLSPYGSWVNDPNYGYVWVPNGVGPDFSPYLTGGHWVYTEYGWTWVSDYDWGWGPFHYGRWYMSDFGWAWMPGYDWAPAWVVWGDYGGYYCWAPVGPREVLGPHYRPDPRRWYFVPHEHIAQGNIRTYVVDHNTAFHNDYGGINSHINIVTHANTYNQSVFYAGPKPKDVEHFVGHKVEKVTVNNVSKPEGSHVTGNQLNIYRPAIVRTEVQHAAPNKVVHQEEMQRNVNTQQQAPVQQRQVEVQHQQPQQPVQQQRQEWTPPRQSIPRTEAPVQQQPQRSQPVQQQQPRQIDRGFVPTQRSAPMQQPQQHFSQPSYSAPRGGGGGSAPRGGGGGRH